MNDDNLESNPYWPPDLDSPQIPSDGPGVLVRAIGFCMTTSLVSLLAMLPAGFLLKIQLLPDWIFMASAVLFFASLMLAIALVPIMGVASALKSVFAKDTASEEASTQ